MMRVFGMSIGNSSIRNALAFKQIGILTAFCKRSIFSDGDEDENGDLIDKLYIKNKELEPQKISNPNILGMIAILEDNFNLLKKNLKETEKLFPLAYPRRSMEKVKSEKEKPVPEVIELKQEKKDLLQNQKQVLEDSNISRKLELILKDRRGKYTDDDAKSLIKVIKFNQF